MQQPAGRFQAHEHKGQANRDRNGESFYPEHDLYAATPAAVIALSAGERIRVINPVKGPTATLLAPSALVAELSGGPFRGVAALLGMLFGHTTTIRRPHGQSSHADQYLVPAREI